jgi:hypothetical protein
MTLMSWGPRLVTSIGLRHKHRLRMLPRGPFNGHPISAIRSRLSRFAPSAPIGTTLSLPLVVQDAVPGGVL